MFKWSFVWAYGRPWVRPAAPNYCHLKKTLQGSFCMKGSPNPNPCDLPAPLHMLIQGGSAWGSQKSAVTGKLTELAKEYGLCSISSAMTAIAALCMENSSTNHISYHIGVDCRNQSKAKSPRNKDLPDLSESQKSILSSEVRRARMDNTPVITFIDEVSLMTTINLGQSSNDAGRSKAWLLGPLY
jgi:hypothetical protein